MAAIDAWKSYGSEPVIDQAGRYDQLYAFWAGTWRVDPAIRALRQSDPRLYQNTRLVWNLARAVVRLYAQSVYQGDLSTDGQPLPDGTRGAIPVDPQTGDDAQDQAIRRACAELWAMWNWRQHMSLRPKYAAILGDCLTELVDDFARGKVLPRTVWPGYVTDLELDLVGNVKRYALEYQVVVDAGTKFGQTVKGDNYTFRKEVDGAAFRYYRDGQPHAYPDVGRTVVPNPYGFVPAIWDRHEVVFGDRGQGAFDAALSAAREINSILSHALDYQRKQFGAPVGVKGAVVPSRNGRAALPPTNLTGDPRADAEHASQTMNLLPMDASGDFVTVSLDVGKTVEMVAKLEDALLAEFPEARFGQEILQMTQVTAPGVERALGPIVNSVKQARANHDPQTVKLHQMAIAIMGERLRRGDVPAQLLVERPARYAAFQPFDLTSYGRGALDFGIVDRPVIEETIDERVQRLVLIEGLSDPWSLEQAGVPPEVVARMLADRQKAEQARLDAFNAGALPQDGQAA